MKYILIVAVITLCLYTDFSKAQTASADNKPFQTITFRSIPKGPGVVGVFEGRTPCTEIARQLKLLTEDNFGLLKLGMTFYRDVVTFQPDTFTLNIVGAGDLVKSQGSSYRQKVLKGKWTLSKGIKSHPHAEVYELAFDEPRTDLYLLKGDDNVLFILDENKEFRVGNEDLSYTLNRVELVPGKK